MGDCWRRKGGNVARTIPRSLRRRSSIDDVMTPIRIGSAEPPISCSGRRRGRRGSRVPEVASGSRISFSSWEESHLSRVKCTRVAHERSKRTALFGGREPGFGAFSLAVLFHTFRCSRPWTRFPQSHTPNPACFRSLRVILTA